MNQGEIRIGLGKRIVGIVLGMVLALLAPMVLLTQVFSLMTVVMLPSIALVILYRWAGRGPALFSAVLMLAFNQWIMGSAWMFVALLAIVLPAIILLRLEDRPFFQQMRCAIAAFGVGIIAAVGVLYLNYGGNMIERALNLFPAMLRMQPEESLAPILELVSQLLQRPLTMEDFHALYAVMIEQMIPEFQLRLPQLLLSGALITALLSTWLSNRMRARRGLAVPGSFVPVREWALPASTTSGLLLILAVSGAMRLFNAPSFDTAFLAVYGIAVVSFCAQGMASMARRLRASPLSRVMRRVVLVVMVVLLFMGGEVVLALYGCASAILGSRGMLQQRAQEMNNDGRNGGEE